jgi:HEAT repeat protein
MHQDSYERDQNVRHHRVRWLMAFYYPQDVDEQRGPSSVVPATQYLTEEDQDGSPAELPVVGAAGTVTIVHYDLWHRAMANVGERDRYMVKFLFTRMCEPRAAAWNHDGNGWRPTGRADDTICAHLWAWMRGATEGAGPPPATPEELARRLRDGAEVERYDAAYRLGAMGGLPSLLEALREEGECRLAANLERSHTNPAQLDAAYGMTAVGSEAVPTLVDLLAEERWWLRASAADVLGDIGLPAAGSASALASALEDESEWVRRNAAEALGNIGPAAARTASALCARLTDADVAVRHNAALALAKMGTGDATALRRAQDDDDHYVRELSTVALARFQPVQ